MTPAEVGRLLADGFRPADGDRHTAVIAFLVEDRDRKILIDAGSGHSLGLDTGCVATNLAARSSIRAISITCC